MTGWARILRGALVAALLADGAFVLARAHADGALHAQRSPFASGSGPAGLPSGYLADGTVYEAPAHFGCALIQYISTECQYCRIERPVADTLAELWFGVGALTAARAGQAMAALPAALR